MYGSLEVGYGDHLIYLDALKKTQLDRKEVMQFGGQQWRWRTTAMVWLSDWLQCSYEIIDDLAGRFTGLAWILASAQVWKFMIKLQVASMKWAYIRADTKGGLGHRQRLEMQA